MSLSYVARAPIILNYTIVAVNTWELITGTGVKGVRKWFLKTRDNTDNAFDMAFKAAPTTYLTSDGSGFTFDDTALPAVYVRTSTAGTVFELAYFN